VTAPVRRLPSAGSAPGQPLTQNLGGRPGGLVPFVSVVGSCLGRNSSSPVGTFEMDAADLIAWLQLLATSTASRPTVGNSGSHDLGSHAAAPPAAVQART
jgi:hypothetical protein